MTSMTIALVITVPNVIIGIINYRRHKQLKFSARMLDIGTDKLVQFKDSIKQTYYDTVRNLHDILDKNIQQGYVEPNVIKNRDKLFSQLIEMELGDELKVL